MGMNEIDHHSESRMNRVLYLQFAFRSNLESDVSLLLFLPMNLQCQCKMMIQRKEREEV